MSILPLAKQWSSQRGRYQNDSSATINPLAASSPDERFGSRPAYRDMPMAGLLCNLQRSCRGQALKRRVCKGLTSALLR
jgi:hypothetical protein